MGINSKKTSISFSLGRIDIFEPMKNGSVDISNLVADHYPRDNFFDLCFYDFGMSLKKGINSVSNKKYKDNLTENDLRNLSVLKFIANKNNVDQKDSLNYFNALKAFSSSMKEFIPPNYSGVIVPYRGGGLLVDILGIKLEEIIPIDCKRVQLEKEGEVGLGMNIGIFSNGEFDNFRKWYEKRIRDSNDKEIVFLEIAIASGLTTLAFMTELYRKNINPSKITIIAPFASIRGREIIEGFAKKLGFKIKIYSKLNIRNLGNYWEDLADSLKDEKGKYVIGKVTEILSKYIVRPNFYRFV